MLLRFGIDDMSKKMPKGQKGKRVFKSMPVNHSQEKVDASAEVGFPMLIGAGENGQKTIVRRRLVPLVVVRMYATAL